MLSTAMQTALTGTQAFSTRLQANSNNIANLNTDGFKRDIVNLSSTAPQGVETQFVKSTAEGPAVYEDTSNGQKLVEKSNVDLVKEIPESRMNAHGYTANLKTIKTADEMLGSLLDSKA